MAVFFIVVEYMTRTSMCRVAADLSMPIEGRIRGEDHGESQVDIAWKKNKSLLW